MSNKHHKMHMKIQINLMFISCFHGLGSYGVGYRENWWSGFVKLLNAHAAMGRVCVKHKLFALVTLNTSGTF